MAPYIYDASQYDGYNSNMAALKLRNRIVKYMPIVSMTDVHTGETHEVFDRLYLLWRDQYVTLDRMKEIGITTASREFIVEGQGHSIGEMVPIPTWNSVLYAESYNETLTATYKITEIIEEMNQVIIYGGAVVTNVPTYTNVTKVKLQVPITPFYFDKLGPDNPENTEFAHNMLLDADGYNARKRLYKYLGADKVIEDGAANGWSSLDKAWLQFSDKTGSELDTTGNWFDTWFEAYKLGFKEGNTYTIPMYYKTDWITEGILHPEDMQEYIADKFTDGKGYYNEYVTDNGVSDNDKTSILFLYLLGLLDEDSEFIRVDRKIMLPVTVTNGTRVVGVNEDNEWIYEFWAEGTQEVTITVLKQIAETNDEYNTVKSKVYDAIRDVNWSYNSNNYDGSITTAEPTYYKFIDTYGRQLTSVAHVKHPDYWLTGEVDTGFSLDTNIVPRETRYLRVDKFKKAKVKDLQDLYDTMKLDNTADDHSAPFWVKALTGIVVTVLIVAAVASGNWYAIAGVSATLTVMSIVYTNMGYYRMTKLVGNSSKMLGYAVAFTGSYIQFIQTTVIGKALQEVYKRVVVSIGGEAAVIINSVITVGASLFSKGSDSGTVIHGIMAGISQGMATSNQLSVNQMSDYKSLIEDQQEILNEIDEKQSNNTREMMEAACLPEFIPDDQMSWNSYKMFNQVDRLEDGYQELENKIDSTLNKNWKSTLS